MSKKSYYPEPNQNLDFAALEQDILKFWQENKVFEKSVEIRNFAHDEDNNVSPVKEQCALKDHAACRHDNIAKKHEFVFYDGPPFANGLPHYGHLLTGFIKDIFARYQTMKGHKVERKFGWDTHGLPVEMETEKELTAKEGRSISGQIAIQEYGIEKFNAACEKSVMKYADEWKNYVGRQGRWVDFDNGYKTMDINYMESVIWAFKSLYDKGLLYEDFRVMPYSWACQTPVSNFETRMDNAYRQKESAAVTIAFELTGKAIDKFQTQNLDNMSRAERHNNRILKVNNCIIKSKLSRNKQNQNIENSSLYLLAWTTTPWTLPSNLALAVHEKDIEYSALQKDNKIFILAKNSVSKFSKELDGFIEIFPGADLEGRATILGSDLIGSTYKPLFPYFKEKEEYHGAFCVLGGDFVTAEDGTGIVHMAPGFGEDDQALCKANGIPALCPVDEGGKFTSEIFDLEYFDKDGGKYTLKLKGRNVLGYDEKLQYDKENNPNKDIIIYLKATGAWLKTEQYLHNYPHCWRTDTPLIYRAVSSWYVEVTKFKDRMVELNQDINWIPDHIKDGQFGKWLEGARDWSITRNRFWGCPVPVWRSDDPQYPRLDVYGSRDEIARDFGARPENLHRPFIDQLARLNPNDPRHPEHKNYDKNNPDNKNCSQMKRVSDVLDCWFESGSMPYAQVHYPFENKEWFEQNFPADFITEYVAQTRGWFYTLMVLSTALFDRAPFKNVICHGTILDENSQKLSKRLRNYADPLEVFANVGSDAMRFYMISQPVMRGQELRIDKEGKAFHDTLRLAIKPLINAYNFFCLYANSDGIKAQRIDHHRSFNNTLDRYILSKLKSTTTSIDAAMENYDTVAACEEFNQFFEALNNWYIRRSRQRFWKSEVDQDKQDAYDVLYTVLLTMCEASAPLLPFTTEFLWRGLSI